MEKFLDKPKIYHWMKQEEIGFLMEMHSNVLEFLKNHSKLGSDYSALKYFPDIGESSYLVVIETINKNYVLKSTKDPQAILNESKILEEWHRHGIKTPILYEEGEIQQHPYIIMDYIDAPILRDAYSNNALIGKGYITQMGQILRKMTAIKGFGYGVFNSSNFTGEYKSFGEFITKYLVTKPSYKKLVNKKYLTTEAIDKIDRAIKTIEQNATTSTLCHMDFSVYNIFATEPLTVFDPGEAKMNHPYIDLAQTLLIFFNLSNDISLFKKVFLAGYFNEGEKANDQLLNACLYIQGVFKLTTWMKKKRYFKAKVLKTYISELKF